MDVVISATSARFSHEGLPCVVIKPAGMNHLCGYVGLPQDHPFHGVKYQHILPLEIDGEQALGKRGILPAFLYAMTRETRLDMLIDVHGSVTFSEASTRLDDEAKLTDDPRWWIGFDCNHSGDTPERCNLQYVMQECLSLAEQLNRFGRSLPEDWRPSDVENRLEMEDA